MWYMNQKANTGINKDGGPKGQGRRCWERRREKKNILSILEPSIAKVKKETP